MELDELDKFEQIKAMTTEALAQELADLFERSDIEPRQLADVVSSALLARTRHSPTAAVERALARGVPARADAMEAEGGHISADQAARLLSLSKTAVLDRYKKGQLLGWRSQRQSAVCFPVWQFTGGEVLPGLIRVLEILNQASGIDDWGRIMFFLNPRRSLAGKRPLDRLRDGDLATVERLALADVEP